MDMKSVIRAIGLGLVGFMVPRVLAALGVPFDLWANQLATALKDAPTVIAQETTFTILGLLFGFCLMFAELWWKPLGQVIPYVRNWRNTKDRSAELCAPDDAGQTTNDHWAHRRKMEIMALANVASDRTPTAVPMSEEPVNSRYHVLKEAADEGRLKAKLTGPQADYGAIVDYEDFCQFAESVDIEWVQRIRDRWAQKQPGYSRSPSVSSPRISLVDLIAEARKQGWRFTDDGSQHVFDFVRTFRDAGSTEAVQFWGREKQHTDSMTRDRPLEKISTDYWKKFQRDGISLLRISPESGSASGLTVDNFQTVTVADGNLTQRRLYADIYLDRENALNWLVTEGERRRGEYTSMDCNFAGLDEPWYLQDRETELTQAIFLMIHNSDWGRTRFKNLVRPNNRDALIEAMRAGAQEVRQAAMNGKLVIRGRHPDAVEFEQISADAWKLVIFDLVDDGRGSLKVNPTANDGDSERVADILNFETFEVDSREFEALWPETE